MTGDPAPTPFLAVRVGHRQILSIAVPMILSAITIPLAGMVDTAVVGHLDDVRYLAAVAVSASVFAFLFMIFGFLRMGDDRAGGAVFRRGR